MRDPEELEELGRASRPPEEEEEEEEEEWEEDEEEDDEDWEEEDEEEEEEEVEEKKKPEEKKAESAKEENKAEEAKKEEKKKDDKPKKEDKKKDSKKAAKATKKEKPAGPVDPLKMPRMLFFLGLIIFFLSTCAQKSYIPAIQKQKSLGRYYSGATRKPIKPTEPYAKQSALLKGEDRAKEQEEFNKKYEEDMKAWNESETLQEFMNDTVAHAEWIAANNENAAYAEKATSKLQYSMGAWSRTYFYLGQIGVLLMVIGLSLLFLKADLWERIAALAVLGYAIIPLLKEFAGVLGMFGGMGG